MILNQYYHPDIAPTAQLAADVAEEMVCCGHEVTVVACNRRYIGGGQLPSFDVHRGVRIIRLPAMGFGRTSKLLRMIDYGSYFAASLVPALISRKPDVIVALSTPPFIAVIGAIARRLRGSKLLFWVMDVYPEIAIELGTIARTGALGSTLRLLAKIVLREADCVVALDEAMRERLVSAGASSSRIEVIDNWCDGDQIRPVPRESNPLRRKLGLGDMFTISYSGNMGLGHDFDTITAAMALLRDEPIHWLFIGDGPRRERLRAAAAASGASSVTFLPHQDKEELRTSLTAADASLVTLEAQVAGLLVPSKLYGILAAGVPVIYVGPPDGRVAAVVREADIGVGVRNDDAAGLAAGIRGMLRDRDRCVAMGRRARELFLARYDRPVALDKHRRVLVRTAAGGDAPS